LKASSWGSPAGEPQDQNREADRRDPATFIG
jgi:hypothetical protein